jgi:linoleate 8R-lipoxygenase / 9,12-octadecadienoate 8-hydroperoxide 8R-isomerase
MVHVNFTAQLFNLPLKTEEHKHFPFTEKQLYDILALLFGYVFLDRDETASFKIRKIAAKACDALATLVKFNVKEVSLGGWIKKAADGISKDGFLDSYGNSFIRKLLDAGKSIDEITWIIMPTAAAGTANQGQQVVSSSSPLTIVYPNARPSPFEGLYSTLA